MKLQDGLPMRLFVFYYYIVRTVLYEHMPEIGFSTGLQDKEQEMNKGKERRFSGLIFDEMTDCCAHGCASGHFRVHVERGLLLCGT